MLTSALRRTSALALGLALVSGTALAQGAPSYAPDPTPSGGQAQPAVAVEQPQQLSQRAQEFKQVLAQFGSFQAHARYGEVWVPSNAVVPQGWKPYAPCNWIYTKQLGWYYDDRSEWGRIVHHYGRWAHDTSLGWVWVLGEEFSPGWVVWRTSTDWTGWAPTPPDVDMKEMNAEAFNSDKHWTFMESKKFGTKCEGGQVASYPPANIYQTTQLVTEIRYVNGIYVFWMPPPVWVHIWDIDVGFFPPWGPWFIGNWFWNWNWLFAAININVNVNFCPQPMPLMQKATPIKSEPPAGPKEPPASTPPGGQKPPVYQPPVYQPPTKVPPVYQPPRQSYDPPVYQPPRFTPPPVYVPPRVTDRTPRPPKYPDYPNGRTPDKPGGGQWTGPGKLPNPYPFPPRGNAGNGGGKTPDYGQRMPRGPLYGDSGRGQSIPRFDRQVPRFDRPTGPKADTARLTGPRIDRQVFQKPGSGPVLR